MRLDRPRQPRAKLRQDEQRRARNDCPCNRRPRTAAVYRAIQAYAVALEICDLQQLPDRAESIVASNVLHRAVAFGSWSSRPAAAGVMASLLVDGEMKAADQANLDVAPRLRAAAHVLESVDERLEAGDRIITSLVAQVPLSPGKVVTADMGVLGRVTLSV